MGFVNEGVEEGFWVLKAFSVLCLLFFGALLRRRCRHANIKAVVRLPHYHIMTSRPIEIDDFNVIS